MAWVTLKPRELRGGDLRKEGLKIGEASVDFGASFGPITIFLAGKAGKASQ